MPSGEFSYRTAVEETWRIFRIMAEFVEGTDVLSRIGPEKLWFVTDGISQRVQMHIAVNPVLGAGNAGVRAQRAVDELVAANPRATVAVIPDGPYTMLRVR